VIKEKHLQKLQRPAAAAGTGMMKWLMKQWKWPRSRWQHIAVTHMKNN